MPYDLAQKTESCPACRSAANIYRREFNQINCARCGDYRVGDALFEDLPMMLADIKQQALASYIIRKLQAPRTVSTLTKEFFDSLGKRSLPTPVETCDNLILWLAEQADGQPGKLIEIAYASPFLLGFVGVISPDDIGWIITTLRMDGFLYCEGLDRKGPLDRNSGFLTAKGWKRFEELKRAHISSNYAFFARKFSNPDLDTVFSQCLWPGVKATGYELRTVTQRAGLVDAVIEDEIRRCRFLIADLSDDNAGAYWEAGFAEGLGKPVIYVCRAGMKTHFDADHRHTVRWDLSNLDATATQLKAVIRNTLLGDANQSD